MLSESPRRPVAFRNRKGARRLQHMGAALTGLTLAALLIGGQVQGAVPGFAQGYDEALVSASQAALALRAAVGLASTDDATGGSMDAVALAPTPMPVSLPAREIAIAATDMHPAYSIYVPEGPDVPRTTLLALHGMGGSGPGIASRLLPQAQAQGWVVIAPTIPYGDWRDPSVLAGEELHLVPQLRALLSSVPDETGVRLNDKALVFGFSRGAQEALRFSLLYPEKVQAVAALSAGTYTLPVTVVQTNTGANLAAPFPYGVADLEQRVGHSLDTSRIASLSYFIGVGASDNKEGDVPRQWDPFVGKTRLERAQRFAAVLSGIGAQTQVSVIPDIGHDFVAQEVEQAFAFLNQAVQAAQAAQTTQTAQNSLAQPIPATATPAPRAAATPAAKPAKPAAKSGI